MKTQPSTPEARRHGKPVSLFSSLKLCLCVSVLALSSLSCAGLARDMGIEDVPDVKLRSGPAGTLENPVPLDPFKTYNLVMAANECRFFQMKVPDHWYWKVYLTAASPRENQKGDLMASIAPLNPPWASLNGTSFAKTFNLNHEGVQAVLGVGNPGEARVAILRLCQDGAPINVTIESQVSATSSLLGPGVDQKRLEGQ